MDAPLARKHHDRRDLVVGPRHREHFRSVQVGQQQVEQNEVKPRTERLLDALLAGRRPFHRRAVPFEHLAQVHPRGGRIVNREDALAGEIHREDRGRGGKLEFGCFGVKKTAPILCDR
jgi:hypothetical protein